MTRTVILTLLLALLPGCTAVDGPDGAPDELFTVHHGERSVTVVPVTVPFMEALPDDVTLRIDLRERNAIYLLDNRIDVDALPLTCPDGNSWTLREWMDLRNVQFAPEESAFVAVVGDDDEGIVVDTITTVVQRIMDRNPHCQGCTVDCVLGDPGELACWTDCPHCLPAHSLGWFEDAMKRDLPSWLEVDYGPFPGEAGPDPTPAGSMPGQPGSGDSPGGEPAPGGDAGDPFSDSGGIPGAPGPSDGGDSGMPGGSNSGSGSGGSGDSGSGSGGSGRSGGSSGGSGGGSGSGGGGGWDW